MRLIRGVVAIVVPLAAGCFSPDQDDGGDAGTQADTSGSGDATMTTQGDPTLTSADSSASITTSVGESESSATDTVDPDTSAGEEEGPPVDCDAPDGEPDDVCPATAPFCQGGTCVGCDEVSDGHVACVGLDPAAPICADDGSCAACSEHEQCPTGACRIGVGECFPEPNRLWVDNTAPNCAAGTGAEDNPFCQITTAMDVIGGQVGTDPWAIFVAGSPTAYTGTIDPNGDRPLAIVGPDAGLAAALDGGTGYAVDLWAQAPETYLAHLTLTADDLVVRGGGSCEAWFTQSALAGGSIGIDTGGCTIHLSHSIVENFGNYGIGVASNGTLDAYSTDIRNGSGGMVVEGTARLDTSRVRDHYVGGGISIMGGHLELVNSFVTYNQYANDGIDNAGGSFDILYSTVIGAIECTNAQASTIRNSIVLGHMFEAGQICATAAVDYSVVNVGVDQGTGNVLATADDLAAIFVDPSPQVGEYHVMPGSIPADVAVWADGDPLVDFDGDERPGVAGEPDYAGADVP